MIHPCDLVIVSFRRYVGDRMVQGGMPWEKAYAKWRSWWVRTNIFFTMRDSFAMPSANPYIGSMLRRYITANLAWVDFFRSPLRFRASRFFCCWPFLLPAPFRLLLSKYSLSFEIGYNFNNQSSLRSSFCFLVWFRSRQLVYFDAQHWVFCLPRELLSHFWWKAFFVHRREGCVCSDYRRLFVGVHFWFAIKKNWVIRCRRAFLTSVSCLVFSALGSDGAHVCRR